MNSRAGCANTRPRVEVFVFALKTKIKKHKTKKNILTKKKTRQKHQHSYLLNSSNSRSASSICVSLSIFENKQTSKKKITKSRKNSSSTLSLGIVKEKNAIFHTFKTIPPLFLAEYPQFLTFWQNVVPLLFCLDKRREQQQHVPIKRPSFCKTECT